MSDFTSLKVNEERSYDRVYANSVVTALLDAGAVSQRTLDYINSGGVLTDPTVTGQVNWSGATIPSDLIGPDFQALVDSINTQTFDASNQETYVQLNKMVGQSVNDISFFVANFYLEFHAFRKGILARLATIPFPASLNFQLKPRILVISSDIQPMANYKFKVLWGTAKTGDLTELTPDGLETIQDILGSVNPYDEDIANRIQITNMLIPSSSRISVKIGKYSGDGVYPNGGDPVNWNQLAVAATDDDLITAGWLTDLVEIEPIYCQVTTTASVVTNPPQDEFDLPVYVDDLWIQKAFVIAGAIVSIVAKAAKVPIPPVPIDSWNGSSFSIDNLNLPTLEASYYVDLATMADTLYKENGLNSPLIGSGATLGTIFNDDSWVGYTYVGVHRGEQDTLEGTIPPEWTQPPLAQGANAVYSLGQDTGYTNDVGLGEALGVSLNYLWRTVYGVKFIDWDGSTFKTDIDPLSTDGGPTVLYRYSGAFDKSGITVDGAFINDPSYNYVSVGGRPFIYYQDVSVPAINDRAALVVQHV